MKELFAHFHDICSFVAVIENSRFSFTHKSADFEDRFGEPETLEQDNGYLPYFLKYLYSDDTLSGFCFPAPKKILGFDLDTKR